MSEKLEIMVARAIDGTVLMYCSEATGYCNPNGVGETLELARENLMECIDFLEEDNDEKMLVHPLVKRREFKYVLDDSFFLDYNWDEDKG